MKKFAFFLALLGLALCSLDAQVKRLQLAIGEIQFIDDNGAKPDPELETLIENARAVFNDLYGLRVELLTAPPTTQTPVVSIKAIETNSSQLMSLQITADNQEFTKSLLQSYHQVSAKSLANVWFYLVNQADSFSRFSPSALPQLVDRIDTSQILPLDMPIYTNLPYAVATRSNGNVLIGLMGLITEIDSHGKVIEYWGKSLAADRNYNFAYEVRVSPSGTIFSKGSGSADVMAFGSTQDLPRKINSQISLSGGFIVLSDGSFLVKDAMNNKTIRFDGRKKTELNLASNPQYPYFLIAAGADASIVVFDSYSGELRNYDKTGQILDRIMPLIPGDKAPSVRQLLVYPDGSILFLGMDFLMRTDRNGLPLWYVDKANSPGLADNTLTMSLAFDPDSASIYLVKSGNKELFRILDTAWALEHQIDTTPLTALIKSSAALLSDPEDWDAILAKADCYLKNGAKEVALALLMRLAGMEPGNQLINSRLTALKLEKFLTAAESGKSRVINTMRTIGPESARADYQEVLKLYEQTLALDPGNRIATKSRSELINAMRQAEQTPVEIQIPPLNVVDIKLDNLFPALVATYKNQSIGHVTIHNDSVAETKSISLNFFIPRFMDFPGEMPTIPALQPGQTIEIPLTAQFNQEALKVEEDLNIQAQITLGWVVGGEKQSLQKSVGTTLYRRSALTWDKSGKLASFMTPNEENVNTFALRCLDQSKGITAQENALRAFSEKIWRASVIADALGAYGIAYLEDPQSPISATLGKNEAIDTVRFPRTTLFYKSGDCDDSSALLASLYEAAGLQTAIMTSPGHVFIAFNTGEAPENAWMFGGTSSGAAIIKNQTIWLPIETTDLKNGFRHAWLSAANLVAKYLASQDLEILPVHEQWTIFPSIPLPQSPYQVVLPGLKSLQNLLENDAVALNTSLYETNIKTSQNQLPASGKTRISQLNRIGILQARFGFMDRAIPLFQQALKEDKNHIAAYLNLSSVFLSTGKPAGALSLMQQAKALRPESSAVQSLLAQAYFAMGDLPKTQEAYLALQADSTERAGNIGARPQIIWSENGE